MNEKIYLSDLYEMRNKLEEFISKHPDLTIYPTFALINWTEDMNKGIFRLNECDKEDWTNEEHYIANEYLKKAKSLIEDLAKIRNKRLTMYQKHMEGKK